MFLEDRQSLLASGKDGFSELYDLPVPRGERPLGGEPVPYASEELVALLDGLGVLSRGAGVRRTQRGEQYVEKLPAVRRRSLDYLYVVVEERDDAGPGAAGGEVGEGRGWDPVDGDALLLPRGVADGHVTFARGAVDRNAGLGAGEVRAPPDDLVLLRGAGRRACDVEGNRLEQVGLSLGVVPDDYVQAGGEQGRGVDVVAEVDQAQGPEVGAQVATSNRSSTTSITSPFSSFSWASPISPLRTITSTDPSENERLTGTGGVWRAAKRLTRLRVPMSSSRETEISRSKPPGKSRRYSGKLPSMSRVPNTTSPILKSAWFSESATSTSSSSDPEKTLETSCIALAGMIASLDPSKAVVASSVSLMLRR